MNNLNGMWKRALSLWIAFSVIAALLLPGGAALAQDGEPPEPAGEPPAAPDERAIGTEAKRWTVMVYMAADNYLEPYAINDFLEMSQVGSTGFINIVAQMDRISGFDNTCGDWKDTRRFYITHGMTPTAANGTSIGEQNMGGGATLRSFINWAKTNYPAEKYALIIWNHGQGFQPTSDEITTAGVAWDDTSSGDWLSNKELSTVLNQVTGNGAQKLDVIGFDADYMAQMEVHQHVKNYAKFGVGSEKDEPDYGWPYQTILTWLKNNSSADGLALVNKITDLYYVSYSNDQMQSAVRYDTNYATVLTRLNTFSNQLIARINYNSAFRTTIGNALAACRKPGTTQYFVDLYNFAHQIQARTAAGTALNSAAINLKSAISNMVTRNRVGVCYLGNKGVSIYFPKDQATWNTWDALYGANQWLARDTHWDEFLQKYYEGEMRIELTWGSAVNEISSFFYLPPATPYRVCWLQPGSMNTFPYATVIDATSPGPEISTAFRLVPGVYEYVAVKLSGEATTLKESGAVVNVYRDGTLALTVDVSTASGSGMYWDVFSYDTATDSFTVINTMDIWEPGPY